VHIQSVPMIWFPHLGYFYLKIDPWLSTISVAFAAYHKMCKTCHYCTCKLRIFCNISDLRNNCLCQISLSRSVSLIFDEEKFKELKKAYERQDQDNGKTEPKDAAPAMDIESKKKVTDTLEDESEGSVSSEGYRVCGFIIE
jgi:hypothetical protein